VNLRQIAIAYATYVGETGSPRTLTADSLYDWAFALAKEGGINEANLYYAGEDPIVAASTAAHSCQGRHFACAWSAREHDLLPRVEL